MTAPTTVTAADVQAITTTRATDPGRIARLWAERRQPARGLVGQNPDGRLMLIAADHPARGALRAGQDALAMGDRSELLDRMVRALSRPGVDGVLGTADVIEDLLLLGALDDKVVIGSMNRGGLAGTVLEMDDRYTGHDAATIEAFGFQGGKMLFRIDPDDASTVPVGGKSRLRPTIMPRTTGLASAFDHVASWAPWSAETSPPSSSTGRVVAASTASMSSTTGSLSQV